MITDVTGLTGYNAGDYEKKENTDSIGQDEFLKLFLSQLKHQDPLNPMDSAEFTAQLAQFSSVEQLFKINGNIESLAEIQGGSSRFQAIELIGKNIEAEGNIISIKEGETGHGSFITNDKAECTVHIKDTYGNTVRDMGMGTIDAGLHSFKWDGRDSNGKTVDEGFYVFSVDGLMTSGDSTYGRTYIKGQVDRINMEGDEPLVFIGDMALSMSQIVDISLPETE